MNHLHSSRLPQCVHGTPIASASNMKRFLLYPHLLAVGSFLVTGTVYASPCYAPKRLVNGYTVDLQPLMNWWPAPKGARPLSGWKHIRGTIVRDTPSGWVISGKAEGQAAHSTFFLKNPPRDRLRRFEELKRQLPELERAEVATQQYLNRPVCTDWYAYYANEWQAPPISMTEYREAGAILGEVGRSVNAVRAELGSMQDAQGNFRVDAFALKLNESFEGLPVFDHGAAAAFRFAAVGN